EVPVFRSRRSPAEVRRLVPAVARRRQRRDDLFEVAFHRLGLARELRPVSVGEASARLRLELVAAQVLGLERQRLGEVALEIGGALPRNSVDEVERDVVETGITESVEGAADVVWSGNAVENAQQPAVEALCADRHTV